MCGCNKINGMKRKRISGFGSAASNLLPILAGYMVGKVASKQLTALSSNPKTGDLIKVGAGLFFASKSGFMGGFASGIALEGASNLISEVLPDSIGLLPPGAPARYIAGFPEQIEATMGF